MMPGIRERVLNIIKNKTERAENLVWAKIRAVVMVLAFFCPRITRISTNVLLRGVG